mmetsp:Transcript_4173/g.8660  ORF Transcript_4173/g.8660 Transcript_4173/m.8660 type:complete len:97 (-) Transcript_4173:191-481(-)
MITTVHSMCPSMNYRTQCLPFVLCRIALDPQNPSGAFGLLVSLDLKKVMMMIGVVELQNFRTEGSTEKKQKFSLESGKDGIQTEIIQLAYTYNKAE